MSPAQMALHRARTFALIMMLILGALFVVAPEFARGLLGSLGLLDPVPAMNAESLKYVDFVYGILGAVMIGWTTSLILLVEDRGTPWFVVMLSICVWFVVDTALSLWTGHPRNAALNVIALVGLVGPHVALRRSESA